MLFSFSALIKKHFSLRSFIFQQRAFCIKKFLSQNLFNNGRITLFLFPVTGYWAYSSFAPSINGVRLKPLRMRLTLVIRKSRNLRSKCRCLQSADGQADGHPRIVSDGNIFCLWVSYEISFPLKMQKQKKNYIFFLSSIPQRTLRYL